jgi:hypothetical protein
MTKYVEWEDPWYSPGELPVHVTNRMTVEHTINLQKNKAAKGGHTYDTDEQALDDFLVVYWASIVEIPDVVKPQVAALLKAKDE